MSSSDRRTTSRAPGLGLLLATSLLAALLGSAPQAVAQDTTRTSVAVAPPRVPPLLRSVDSGIQDWLQERFSAAGLASIDRALVAEASLELLDEDGVLRGAAVPQLAAKTGATWVVLSEVRYDQGEVDVRLRVHEARAGAVLAGGRAVGRLAELGDHLVATFQSVGGSLDLPKEVVLASLTPSLSELGAYERSRAHLEGGQLAEAWEALAGRRTAAADALRQEIADAARHATPAQRSRLASVRGTSDSDWLTVRQGLVGTREPDVLIAGATAALAREEHERASRLYAEAASAAPANLSAQLGHARLIDTTSRPEEARVAWENVRRLAPAEPEAYEALGSNPSLPAEERAQHWMRAGELRSDRMETQAARRAFESAGRVGGAPGSAPGAAGILATARRNVGMLEARMGNHGEALLSLEEAHALAQDDPVMLAALGTSRHRAGDSGGAEQAFGAALEQDASNPDALVGLGEVLTDEGRPAEAVAPLERAVALRPGDGRARRGLSRAHEGSGDPDAAVQVLDPSAVADPAERARLLSEQAGVHERAGRLGEAQLALEQAVVIEPDDPPLHAALAGVHEAAGDTAAAQEARTRLARLEGVTLGSGGATTTAGATALRGNDVAVLFSSFPDRSPMGGRAFESVVYLGVEQPGDWKNHLISWLHPRALDTDALDLATIQALAERYPLVEPPPLPEAAVPAWRRLRDFGTQGDDIALVNDVLGTDAVFVARLVPRVGDAALPMPGTPVDLEVRMLGGRRSDEVFILANALSMEAPTPWLAWNSRAAVPAALLVLLLIYPVVRGWGTAVVQLDYATQKGTKGFFSIQLSRKPGKLKDDGKKKARSKTLKYQRRVRGWSRTSRFMVGRVTRFPFLPARTWYVGVHGLLQDSKSSEVIGNYLEERRIELKRGQTAEVLFDFKPKEAPLEVRVHKGDEQEDMRIVVTLRGRPDTLRYVREESTLFYVGNGEHVVVLGAGDRVFEQSVTIEQLAGASVAFPLQNLSEAVFHGCPEAVEPYLNGDLPSAARILEQAGQGEVASWMMAEYHRARGESAEAARHYEAAGDLTHAAELSAEEDSAKSATLLEQAGDFGAAAERYAESGEMLKAAQSYEAAYDYESAIDAYRQAGELAKTMELLEKTGGYYEAANLSLRQGDIDRAIRNLQMVDLRDPDYAEACRTLAEVFVQREEWGLAVEKAREAVEVAGDDAAPLELHEQLGNVLEKAGRIDQALEIFEGIRKRDFQYPGMAERIETLRQQVGEQATRAATAAASQAATQGMATAPAAASGADERYEIVEEIGRGGMGIVYKARDTRLGRVVALKRLPDNLRDHPTAVQLFLREARSAAALNHQNIVTLFDADQSADGNYYITMEFLEGLPLDAILKKRRALSAKDTLRLATQISTGLQYAHEQRIVHRDIKTSNLFFTKDRTVKIMDFGLAKMIEEVRKAATVIGGTPYYMAPEQAAGEDLDHRADLYAFGVTLYELLTGSVPFTEGDVNYHHRHTPVPDPRERVAELPEPLVALVLSLMAKTPAERPATTAEVTRQLTQLLQQLS